MSHGHSHPDSANAATSRKLLIATIFTATFVVVELAVGLISNSLALVGDSIHNFTDALALMLALWAVKIGRRPATPAKSYGYHRAGVLVAFINAGTLVALTIYLLVEAWRRVQSPSGVDSGAMLWTAGIAIVLNTVISISLHEEGKSDLTVRSAVLHMTGDALSAVGILIAAVVIRYTGATIADPLVTILIAGLILWSSWGILRETVNLLLEGTPSGIDPQAVARDLASQEGVNGVHHLHIWAIAPRRPALSCHLMLGDVSLRNAGEIVQRVTSMLTLNYQISHTTIQIEYALCPAEDPFCVPENHNEMATTVGSAAAVDFHPPS
jgi:cobalt-zinc-cadmium efflux system protein